MVLEVSEKLERHSGKIDNRKCAGIAGRKLNDQGCRRDSLTLEVEIRVIKRE